MKHLTILMVPAALMAMMASTAVGETAASIRSPQLGGVFEEQSRQIRLIEGIAGAASLGRVVATGAPVEQAWLAPQAKRALVRLGGDAPRLALIDWRNEVTIAGSDVLPSNADAIAFSPSGVAFALLASNKVQVWSIDAGLIRLVWSADAPDSTAVAVDDGASTVAMFGAGQLFIVDASGRNMPLQAMDAFGAMSFGYGSKQLAIAEANSAKVTIFSDVLGGASGEVVWDNGGERITDLSFSGDNRQLVIATNTEQGGRVRVAALGGAKQFVVDTPVQIANLLPAQGNAVFQLTSLAKGIIYLIDADSDEPHLIAVPGIDSGVVNE